MKNNLYQPNDASNGIICNSYPELDLNGRINTKGLMYAQISAMKSNQPDIYFHLLNKYKTRNDKGDLKHLMRRIQKWRETPDNTLKFGGITRGRFSSKTQTNLQQIPKSEKRIMTPPEGGYPLSIYDIGEGENGGQEVRVLMFKPQLDIYSEVARKFNKTN